MLERYTGRETTALSMELEELIGYLRNTADPALTPMQSILVQTESIGDPALPTGSQTAILEWVGTAFEEWEREFPLEPVLMEELRRLKPLAAALAIVDPDFLTPGEHPLHRILDGLQLGAVGWQPTLGRAGQALESQFRNTVDAALAWFDGGEVDLAALCEKVLSTTEKDLSRAGRMAQRMIEAEQGRLKTAEAKRVAAGMINAALQQFPVPQDVDRFLKGPWYASAQLVLLRFGADSEQWAHMSETTSILLDSLQAENGEDASRRQRLFEVVTQLPKDLRRWLLSLQLDSTAVGDALGIVESAHLQILRRRPLELEHATLIPVAEEIQADSTQDTLQSLQAGRWFSVDMGDGDPVRAKLVLKIDSAGQLLFANLAGIQVLQQSFEEFAGLINSGKVTQLDSGASFSRSLASAAGIATPDDLESLLGEEVLQARRQQEQRQRIELEQLQRQQLEAERLARERQEEQRLEQQRHEAMRQEQERVEAEHLEQEQLEAEQLQREWDEAQRLKQQRQEIEQQPPEPAPPGYREAPLDSTPPALRDTALMEERVDVAQGSTLTNLANTSEDPAAIDLPMGTWLGFHDGDMPLLAKLAVHDRQNNNYIFVNRSGIKMRQLSEKELSGLVQKGLVDILETRSNFRDEISRAKNKPEE